MTLIDFTAALFAASHIVRVLAYWPQIVVLLRVADEARAVSVLSWAMFAFSHGATALYAALILRDAGVFLAFAVSCLCRVLTIALTLYKRRKWAPQAA